jgi:hypothetical protein
VTLILLTDLCPSTDPKTGLQCTRLAEHDGYCQTLGASASGVWKPSPWLGEDLQARLKDTEELMHNMESDLTFADRKIDNLNLVIENLKLKLKRAGIAS